MIGAPPFGRLEMREELKLRLRAGCLHRLQAIGEHGGQDLTICRSPSSEPASLRRTFARAPGSGQSLKRALLLLISLHGLRISEAARRTPADVDPKRWTLTLPNTKDGSPYVIQLSRPVIDALMAYDWRGGKWLFGTSERGKHRPRSPQGLREGRR
jgi:integrase